ncbi:MAG: hypothetical protein ACI9JK_000263 [Phycisphaerales bacterium]|jgi:hypothetical protein
MTTEKQGDYLGASTYETIPDKTKGTPNGMPFVFLIYR